MFQADSFEPRLWTDRPTRYRLSLNAVLAYALIFTVAFGVEVAVWDPMLPIKLIVLIDPFVTVTSVSVGVREVSVGFYSLGDGQATLGFPNPFTLIVLLALVELYRFSRLRSKRYAVTARSVLILDGSARVEESLERSAIQSVSIRRGSVVVVARSGTIELHGLADPSFVVNLLATPCVPE